MALLACTQQLLENQAAFAKTPEHRHPDVHAGFLHVWPGPPVWLLALWLGPEHRQGAAVPLLRQEGHQVHHQMAGVPSAASRVQTPLQDAYRGTAEAHPLPLRLGLQLQLLLRTSVQDPWVRAGGLYSRWSMWTKTAYQTRCLFICSRRKNMTEKVATAGPSSCFVLHNVMTLN